MILLVSRPNFAAPAGALAFTILACSFSSVQGKEITVAADGSGDFKTIQEAIAAVPDKSAERTIIHIKPGTYEGQKILPAGKDNVTFQGDVAAQ
jgi:pectinesterase